MKRKKIMHPEPGSNTSMPDDNPLPPAKQPNHYKVKLLRKHYQLSFMQLLLVVLAFGAVGGVALWQGFAAAPPTKAYQPPHAINLPADVQAKRDTMQLVSLTKKLQKKPGDASLIQQTTALAAVRATDMRALISQQPPTAVQIHFPAALLSSLPASARASVESEVSLQGTLHLTHGEALDPKTGQLYNPVYYYTLTDSSGNKYNLHFSGEGPEELGGSTVNVKGVALDTDVAVNSTNDVSVVSSVEAATTATTKKVAVLLFTFSDNTTQPIPADQAKADIFGTTAPSVNTYYAEQSFNQVGLGGILDAAGGDVYGNYALSDSSSSCSYSTWATDAKKAAAAAGANLSGYSNYVYVFPQVNACAWAGLSDMPGSNSWINFASWFTAKDFAGVTSHELGHAFGVNHASDYICTGSGGVKVAYSSTCTSEEYGDPYDVMGNTGYFYEMNAFHKGQLNYLQAANTQTVTASGTYTIAPDEYSSLGTQSLRIPITYNSSNQPTSYIYADFRQPGVSYDKFSPTNPAVNGVSIRIAPPYTTLTQSHLLDMTPTSTLGFNDSALTVGKTFTDSVHNVSITTASIAPSGATVQVSLSGGGTPTCTHANPTISVSPTSQWGNPGDGLSYSATITNTDSGACTASSFNLTSSLPSGLSQSPASSQVSLAPGASTTVAFKVTSASSLVAGFYNFTETATNASATTYTASTTAAYNVNSLADTTAPTASVSSPTSGATVSASVSVTASATDNVGVTTTELYIDGLLRTYNTSSSLSYIWDTTQETNSTHIILVKAYDAAGNVGISASVSATVNNQNDSVAPAVTITSPINGYSITSKTKKLPISASAVDNIGVTKMEVYIDGNLKTTSTAGSISYSWPINRQVASGSHTITVKAYDAAGNVGQSQVTVTK